VSKVLLGVVMLSMAWLAGCGDELDDRPADLDYIVVTVLRPACGTASCHSSLTKTAGFAFDTVEETIASIEKQAGSDEPLVVAGNPEASLLWEVLVGDAVRMPPDGPIPDKDLALIEEWITTDGSVN